MALEICPRNLGQAAGRFVSSNGSESRFTSPVKPVSSQLEREDKMSGRFQIKCINKPNRDSPVEHITHVGGFGNQAWKLSVEEVMRRIESRGADHEDFYVKVGTNEADVIVVQATAHKRKHIRTTPDLTKVDNLLSLPECP